MAAWLQTVPFQDAGKQLCIIRQTNLRQVICD